MRRSTLFTAVYLALALTTPLAWAQQVSSSSIQPAPPENPPLAPCLDWCAEQRDECVEECADEGNSCQEACGDDSLCQVECRDEQSQCQSHCRCATASCESSCARGQPTFVCTAAGD